MADAAPRVPVTLDGRRVLVRSGTSVAAALLEQGHWNFRVNRVSGQGRGPYCGMGVCLECEVTVNERTHVRACLERVCEGMRIGTGTAEEEGT
ncbi:(2Fe-2S)-binding protein [Nocardiopsis quinghaiensis]|uniref:(2Fe-2S)-binding protein n=1 Tax=Nocardiopsis quinghaiensis TaxID=464995 RepID=UPI00123A2C8E|nr:(2Fe-2S)-binding protein [Nocardiopsis quinghaiensis]